MRKAERKKSGRRKFEKKKSGRRKKEIGAVIMDVDGTLTDGFIHISGAGELFKSFYCRDGIGILEAEKKGIEPVILTSRSSGIVTERAAELGIRHVLQDYGDRKKEGVLEVCRLLNLTAEQIAYIGDDVNDREAMELCAVTGCPCDAAEEIKRRVDYVCVKEGGKGAVREFIEYLLGDCPHDS